MLRRAALRGGAFLAARHSLSLVIHLAGVTLLTKAIGPDAYGRYVGALGVQTYLYQVAQLGLIVFLIRDAGEVGDKEFDQAFSLLAAVGIAVAFAVYTGLSLVEGWIGIQAFVPVGRALVLVLPVQLLGLVAMGRLERALDYTAVAPAELAGYVMFYAVALPLARAGFGMWAPVAGYWAQQLLLAAMLFRGARYRPHFCWDPPLIREMLSYGVRYSGANWIWQMRELINPVIVGRLAGPTAVAFVALTVRLVDALSFLKGIGWRISIAVFGRLQSDSVRMLRALNDGMRLQVLSLGVVLTGFGFAAPWVIPRLFGQQWALVTAIYPFIALDYLTYSMFQLETSMLNVVKLTRSVAEFHLLHLALFASATAVLVPRLGAIGYGWAAVVAHLGYIWLHVQVKRLTGSPDYRLAGLWWAAFVGLLFWRQLGWYCLIGPTLALLWPETTREFRNYVVSFANLRHAE
ncbi:MAG TPA: oligosaccharide flippase family protein [Gemmatirosa sp.]